MVKHPQLDVPHYHIRRTDLSSVRTKDNPLEVQLVGNSLTFYTDGSLSGIELALDVQTNDWIPIDEFGNPYKYPARFERFFLVWTAQSGKYLRIHVGDETGAEAKSQFVTASRETQGVFTHGQTTIGTSAVQVSSTSFVLKFGLVIKADDGNSDNVYVGDIDVTAATGFKLDAGQGISLEVDNATKVYCIADAVSQVIHYVGV